MRPEQFLRVYEDLRRKQTHDASRREGRRRNGGHHEDEISRLDESGIPRRQTGGRGERRGRTPRPPEDVPEDVRADYEFEEDRASSSDESDVNSLAVVYDESDDDSLGKRAERTSSQTTASTSASEATTAANKDRGKRRRPVPPHRGDVASPPDDKGVRRRAAATRKGESIPRERNADGATSHRPSPPIDERLLRKQLSYLRNEGPSSAVEGRADDDPRRHQVIIYPSQLRWMTRREKSFREIRRRRDIVHGGRGVNWMGSSERDGGRRWSFS